MYLWTDSDPKKNLWIMTDGLIGTRQKTPPHLVRCQVICVFVCVCLCSCACVCLCVCDGRARSDGLMEWSRGGGVEVE